LRHQPARIDAGPVAAVPALRALADAGLDRADRAGDALALLVRAEVLVALPAPAMRADVPVACPDGAADLGVALQGQGAGEQGGGKLPLAQQPRDAPEAHAAAVLEHRFGRQVAAGEAARAA